MGQSATLYSIDQKVFSKIQQNQKDISIMDLSSDYLTFEKSFEGHIFVLSKFLDSDFISEIFYPKDYLGEKIDYDQLDFDTLSDDFDFEGSEINYNSPDKLKKISDFLNQISVEDYIMHFDPDELNHNEIYTGDVWNNETDENYAFNTKTMGDEFVQLKKFINRYKDQYIICTIG